MRRNMRAFCVPRAGGAALAYISNWIYNETVRPVCFLGDSLKSIRDFPDDARHDVAINSTKFSGEVNLKTSSQCRRSEKAWRKFAFRKQVARIV